jgi:hypothetical protein
VGFTHLFGDRLSKTAEADKQRTVHAFFMPLCYRRVADTKVPPISFYRSIKLGKLVLMGSDRTDFTPKYFHSRHLPMTFVCRKTDATTMTTIPPSYLKKMFRNSFDGQGSPHVSNVVFSHTMPAADQNCGRALLFTLY